MSGNLDLFGDKNPNTTPMRDEKGVIRVRMCPVCGSTDLIASILTNARQTEEGVWQMEQMEDVDTTYEMTNPNNMVSCANPECGVPKGADGNEIPIPEGMSYFAYWLQENGYPTDTAFDALSEDERVKYQEWEAEIWHTPWSGVIDDCQIQEM